MQDVLRNEVGAGTPGVVAAVVTDHGTWEGSAGVDGRGVMVDADALMAIGSVSKTFTAAEVLHLAAVGKVDLDAPMSRYVQSPLVLNQATVRQAVGMLAGVDDGDFIMRMRQSSVRSPDARISLDHSIALDTEKPGHPGGDAGLQQRLVPAPRTRDRDGDAPELRGCGAR